MKYGARLKLQGDPEHGLRGFGFKACCFLGKGRRFFTCLAMAPRGFDVLQRDFVVQCLVSVLQEPEDLVMLCHHYTTVNPQHSFLVIWAPKYLAGAGNNKDVGWHPRIFSLYQSTMRVEGSGCSGAVSSLSLSTDLANLTALATIVPASCCRRWREQPLPAHSHGRCAWPGFSFSSQMRVFATTVLWVFCTVLRHQCSNGYKSTRD